jgi:phosphoglycolate phosphatase
VVFDLDGTLVDSAGDLAQAVNIALQRLAPGTRTLPVEEVRTYIGNGASVLIRRVLESTSLPIAVEQVRPIFLEAYAKCLLDTTRLYPGAEEALEALRDRTLAVLTNKPGDMSRALLSGLGVAHRFARIYGGGDLPAHKPDPIGLVRLMEDARTSPGETVMVGDSAIDVQTGRRAGAKTVGVSYGFDPGSFAAERPDFVLDDLRRLPGVLTPGTVLR